MNELEWTLNLLHYYTSTVAARKEQVDNPHEFLYQRELDFSKKAVEIINNLSPRPA